MADSDRPQDVGRPHSRSSRLVEDDPLVKRYHDTMRAWLGRLLDDLDGRPAKPGLLPDAGDVTVFPETNEASKLWDLAIKLGKELGSSIVDPGTAAPAPRATPPRRKGVKYE